MSKPKKPAKKPVKRRTDIERPRNGGLWTEARYFQFIRTALRKASSRWGPRFEALKEARIEQKINVKTGRLAWHFKCSECSNLYPAKEVQVDHITEVGSLKCFDDLGEWAERLFCEKSGLRVLCEKCHNIRHE